MAHKFDNVIECKGALVLGAGIAGLFTALKLAPFPVTVLAGTRPGMSGSSAWAQGGNRRRDGRRRLLAKSRRRHADGRRRPLRSRHRGAGDARGPRADRRSHRLWPTRRSTASRTARWRSAARRRMPQPHRAYPGRPRRGRDLPHPRRARPGDAVHHAARGLPCRRARLRGRPRHRPLRAQPAMGRIRGSCCSAARPWYSRRAASARFMPSRPILWKRAVKASAWRRAPARSSPIRNSSSSIRPPSTSARIPRRWRPRRCAAKARPSSTRPAAASCPTCIPMRSWRRATSSPAPCPRARRRPQDLSRLHESDRRVV